MFRRAGVGRWHWRWERRFKKRHPVLAQCRSDRSRLRLILGLGRSGTTWLSQLLAATPTPLRFFSEPLSHFVPPILTKPDQGGISYRSHLPPEHRLLRAYEKLTLNAQNDEIAALWEEPHRDVMVVRADANWQLVLVKEVHSLLATEALLRFFPEPAVFITRDPLYILDSLFVFDGLNTMYLDWESMAVTELSFLSRFFSGCAEAIGRRLKNISSIAGKRRRIILVKALTIGLIKSMLQFLGSEFESVKVIKYEDLCHDPSTVAQSCAEWLGLEWGATNQELLRQTSQVKSIPAGMEDICRSPNEQLNRSFKFLEPKDAELGREILNEFGL